MGTEGETWVGASGLKGVAEGSGTKGVMMVMKFLGVEMIWTPTRIEVEVAVYD